MSYVFSALTLAQANNLYMRMKITLRPTHDSLACSYCADVQVTNGRLSRPVPHSKGGHAPLDASPRA